jgi:hypothetical protein
VLSTVWIGGIEVVSLLDGVGDLDDPDMRATLLRAHGRAADGGACREWELAC